MESATFDFVTASRDPFQVLATWTHDAKASEDDSTVAALATVDSSGAPNVRMMLVKTIDENGFVFYTNVQSTKGLEISANPYAALAFHWKSLRRQVRVRGLLERVSPEEADAYFDCRPRKTQIGAWASTQSSPLKDRKIFYEKIKEAEQKFYLKRVPSPHYWTGYRLTPLSVEFWQDRPNRLHDRIRFSRERIEDEWARTCLYP